MGYKMQFYINYYVKQTSLFITILIKLTIEDSQIIK